MKVEKRLQVLVAVAAAFCFIPLLFFVQDIWDGKVIGYALDDHVTRPLWDMFVPTRWPLLYYLTVAIGFIQDTFGISYKVITNVISCVSLAGICAETARILKDELGVEREYRLLAVLTILVLPPWATLMSSILFYHIACIWAFLLAVRWRRTAPVPAALLFIFSLTLNSVFAFAVGYAAFLGLMAVDKTNWRRTGTRVFLFSATLLTVFVLYRHFFPPYGEMAGYNSFNLRVSALVNYAGLFAAFLGGAWLLLRNADPGVRREELRKVLGCCILLFFAGFAYTYVGKPIKLEGTNSFTPRQAFLTAIPVGMLMAVMVRLGVQRLGRRFAYGLAGVLLLLSFSYQYAAFQQKFTQLYFENALADVFRQTEPPRTGVVILVANRDQVPKYLRDFVGVSDYILFEAYGERRWITRVREQDDAPVTEAQHDEWLDELVRRRGLPRDELYQTRVRLDLNGFDPFGSPMSYYYYLTDAYDRLGFKVDYESVEKID